ncbi:YfhO family protein [Streptococcus cuniculipharyngis]|uniref:YfhO family protein n=1 Tax=Streptococcus cuniculipharyngis TaxID=1562651 RepID=A0A5C5SDD9_9STRE|nr:YfhO family protein [Streptococcus cuniculipharyngis]TWS97696.1 YfhO family protein [Streptococcus cuniculipharyngis]
MTIPPKFSKYANLIFYIISFLLPLFIVFASLLSLGISWGSDRTILASDGFHQYVIFAETLKNILHGTDSLFYTFTSGLGLNFYALTSYYLGSFLSPLVYFFNNQTMGDALYLLTLLKFGLIGLSSAYSLKKLYKTVNLPLLLGLSTSYSLMSFATSQLEINMWLDVFILIPLIILGLHQVLQGQGKILYYLTLTTLFIQNYYFGFMTAIFLVLYVFVQETKINSWKDRFNSFKQFTIVSILSGLSSAVMLLPTYLDLKAHGEKFTPITSLFTDGAWYLDLFAKNVVGAYDTTKFGAIPMIYVGIFPLILCLTFFTLKTVKFSVKLAYALLLIFITTSFYLQPLDLLWQGMHAPNMFLHRYAWLLSLTIILLAGETLTHLSTIRWKQFLFPFGLLIAGFTLTAFFTKKYDFLEPVNLILTAAFVLAYLIILVSFTEKQVTKLVFIIFTLIFTITEIGVNTYYQVNGVSTEWVFPARDSYQKNMVEINKLVAYAKENSDSFFRMERLHPQTGNDSMKFNYYGLSQFSSIRNRSSSSTLDRFGFKSTGTNLNLRYQNNTIIMDSLLGIKYNFSQNMPSKFGFQEVYENTGMKLYQNSYASQLGILTEGIYKNFDMTVNTLDNQTKFLNQLSGLSQNYFTRLNASLEQGATILDNQITVTQAEDKTTSVSYLVQIPADRQVYVSVPNLTLSNEDNKTVQINIDGRDYQYTTSNAYSFFNLGNYNQAGTHRIVFSFPSQEKVTFTPPNFYALNLTNYDKAMSIINQKDIQVTSNKNKVTAFYKTDKEASILFTLPYDKGWTAKQNGHPLPIRKAQNGFMAVDVQSGSGTIVLTFMPKGFLLGLGISLLGLLFFCLYLIKGNKTAKTN